MANRTNNLISFLAVACVLINLAMPWSASALESDQLMNPPLADEQSQGSFSIESNDPDVLSGQVYFIISSPIALNDQPIVFLLSVDGSVVRQVSLVALSTTRRHWQVAFDTTQVPNGSYHLVAGKLQADFQLEIWHDAGWKQFFNVNDGKVDSVPTKIFTLPTSTPPQTPDSTPVATSTADNLSQPLEITTTSSRLDPVQSSSPEVTSYCQKQGVLDATQCSVLELTKRYPECQSAGLWQLDECQKYLGRIYFAQACEPEHITNSDQCQQYWQQIAGEHLSCSLLQTQCAEITSKHVGELVAHWIVSEKAKSVLSGLLDKLVTWRTLQQGLSSHGVATDSTMIQSYGFDNRPGLKLAPAQSAMTVPTDDTVISSWSAVMLIDSDADGLTDDAEVRYGTKKDQSDSDGDSYLDGDEVEHGFSPLGSGPLVAPLEAVDKLLFSGRTWLQPLQFGDLDHHLTIANIQPFANGKGSIISGQAQTLQTVTLFIYGSQIPLVASVRADDQGSWKYYLGQPLVEGRYTVYATQMTEDGKVMGKSEAKTMYIKNGQPVTPVAFTEEKPKVLGLDFVSLPSSSMILMIIAGVIVAGSLLFLIGWLVSRKGR